MKRFRSFSVCIGIGAMAFVVCSAMPAFASGTDAGRSNAPEGTYERAMVEQVSQRTRTTPTGGVQTTVYSVRMLSGSEQGKTHDVSGEPDTNPNRIDPREGDTIVIFSQIGQDGSSQYYLEGFDRRGAVGWLVLLFVVTLVLLSGWQGFKVAVSILFSIALIGYVLIPLFLRGVPAVPVAIVLMGVFAFISTGLTTGWNRKSYVTAIGTVGGAIMAYAISVWFANWAHLSGLSSEEDRLFFDKNPHLSPQGLLFAGIIIASAGVVEDVAVSIASGVAEVRRANPRMTFIELFRSGMVIGNDHMGALANTLVYAYVGGSLSTLLLFKQFGSSWLKFINFDTIVDEIIRSLSGTIGLVFTVPITALLSAWVMQKGKQPQTKL